MHGGRQNMCIHIHIHASQLYIYLVVVLIQEFHLNA